MSSLWKTSVLLLFAISFCDAQEWVFVYQRHIARVIQSPEYPSDLPPKNFKYTSSIWYIDTWPWYKIELTCDILIAKSNECRYGMFRIGNGEEFRRICEDTKNLRVLSARSRMTIEFRLYEPSVGKFRCLVKPIEHVSEPMTEEKSEELGSANDTEDVDNSGKRSTTCPCGWTNRVHDKRIVGGNETGAHEYPFVGLLVIRRTNGRICGGSVITPYHILTAAHCVITRTDNTLSFFIGIHDLTKVYKTESAVKADIDHFEVHPGFSTGTMKHDIAIGVLDSKIQFNKLVGPICLPNRYLHLENEYVKGLGWGHLNSKTKRSSNTLQSVELRIVNTESCAAKYQSLQSDSKSQFCTYEEKKDTCQGDSGGPLVWLDPETNRYTQLGLVSYGKTCASTTPAVNTDVSFYLNWIRSVVQKHHSGNQLCVKQNRFRAEILSNQKEVSDVKIAIN